MAEIGAFEAKTHFSQLLERAAKGEEIVITKRGKPYAKIVPVVTTHDVAVAHASFERIRARARKRGLNFTAQDIKSLINEGRKY